MKNKNYSFALILIGTFFLFSSILSYAQNDQRKIEEIKVLLKNGNYNDAEKLTIQSIDGELQNPELLFYRGIIETNQGKKNKAIDTFRDLTERFPRLPEPFNNLAVLYAEKGQFRLAKEILEQAIKTNPSYLTAHINLGDIFTKMASEAYNKALEIDKSNNIAITKLSMITQLFNYNPDTKNTVMDSIKTKREIKTTQLSKKELKKNILSIINNWKNAWESKNMENYLASYSSNFNYPNNMNRTQWEKYRANRIVPKKIINISLSDIKIKFKKEKIKSTFIQNYKSGKLNQISNKSLTFIEENGEWLSLEEPSN